MTHRPVEIWIGFDPREATAFFVARESIRRFDRLTPVNGIVLSNLRARGLYNRPTTRKLGKLWDEISGAYMSTEFAISRFLAPTLQKMANKKRPYGWALFMDCDVMVRGNLAPLIASLDNSKALYCVKHDYKPALDIKMDGQQQYQYARKNWSSVMAINCDHDANKALNVDMVNTMPGRDLHRFCWLDDSEIGELGPEWNYLVGETQAECDPQIVHWTNGGPWFSAFENAPYADEWFQHLERIAA